MATKVKAIISSILPETIFYGNEGKPRRCEKCWHSRFKCVNLKVQNRNIHRCYDIICCNCSSKAATCINGYYTMTGIKND